MKFARYNLVLSIAIIAAVATVPARAMLMDMQAGAAIRGCSNYVEWDPVYQPSAAACLSHCESHNANACEYQDHTNNCYVEFGDGCYVQDGFYGWNAAVLNTDGGGDGSGGGSSPDDPPNDPPNDPSNNPPWTFLINGSFNDNPSWTQPGSGEFNAIAATYGKAPIPWVWTDNGWSGILPSSYSGIVNGGFALAQFINGLPPGDVNLISHSHGGNVVLMSQRWPTRQIRRYIQLATPINWDFGHYRYALAYGTVAGRCQASSTADWKQFFGASPGQVSNFFWNIYQAYAGAREAFEALLAGDYAAAVWWFANSVFDAWQADYWLDTTKYEVEGPTYMFSGLSHAELHEPYVWNVIAPGCS